MLSRPAKFKQLRHFGVFAALAIGLAGCAGMPRHTAAPQASAPQPLDHLVVATPDAEHDLVAQLMAAEMALTHSDLKSAAVHYGMAMMLSNDARVAERATSLALAVHDAPAAARAVDRWQQLGAGPAGLAQARAELAVARGDTAEAQRQLERLIDTGDSQAWRMFGRVLVGARDQAQAAWLLLALATPQRLPNDPQAWLAMSELGDHFGRHDYALKLALAATDRFKTAATYAWAAQMTFKAGDRATARAMLGKAIAKSPKDTRLRLAYASMLAQSGDLAGAAQLLQDGPQDSDTYALRVALAAQMNDTKTLAALYRQLQQAPEDTRQNSAFLLGQLAEMQGLKNEALNWYGQVDDDDPHAFDADLRSAVILHGQGKIADAHDLLGQLETGYLDQPPQLRRAYEADADLYMSEQRYPQAEAAFSHALQVMPDDPGLLYGRGLAYAESGQIDQAVTDLRHLLQIRPNDVDASNALGFTLADANRDLPEAEKLIANARAAKPNDPAIADSWGWLQYRLGHLGQAAQTLRGAWAARQDADVGVHLGVVLWKQGDQLGARQIFEQVRRIDPANSSLHDALKRLQP